MRETITLKEAWEVLNKMSSKLTTFGQVVRTDRGLERVVGGEYESIMLACDMGEYTEITTVSRQSIKDEDIIGNTYLGDVVEILHRTGYLNLEYIEHSSYGEMLAHLWAECGSAQSLQYLLGTGETSGELVDDVQALFIFLKNLQNEIS